MKKLTELESYALAWALADLTDLHLRNAAACQDLQERLLASPTLVLAAELIRKWELTYRLRDCCARIRECFESQCGFEPKPVPRWSIDAEIASHGCKVAAETTLLRAAEASNRHAAIVEFRAILLKIHRSTGINLICG